MPAALARTPRRHNDRPRAHRHTATARLDRPAAQPVAVLTALTVGRAVGMFSKILGESTLMLAGCAGAIAIQAQLLSKAKDKPECAAAEAARQFEMPSDAEIAAMANAALSFERTSQRGERPALVPACG